MRSGFNGLAAKVQMALEEDPFSGHVFVFRGRRGDPARRSPFGFRQVLEQEDKAGCTN
ncbi:hypothetical protein D0T25_27320 [Duganella sp. BJB488]|uniref:IS66 family insertion sequence element accessory protein TnpB n=1 Tax=unclassified Duganella TaxID=2636909 RepID=UPI000E340D89|nr:hypothetical protein D0T26_25970 [Duganella sp. BJB489]RFP14488.1 hypothetical protein D0T25_27320 [Duganella sp. BJB488]RFP30425.1 hypothetical protein D0T24_28025 [Duganella sp. BJB480]